MAWRIHDNVIRGEIDNRECGHVRGKVWLCGQPEPVILELKGNACGDLAGCLLTFENLGEAIPMPRDGHLATEQRGTIGDLTASRKVRVMEIPMPEAYLRKKQGLPVPEHIANSLYLEWFSEFNGRVVIESTDYKLTISTPAWRLTPEQEDRRQHEAAEGFTGFMEKMGEGAAASSRTEPLEDKEWDEFDYEKFMRESDARTDRYSELLDKYMDHPDRDRIIAREMGWTWLEETLENQPETNEAGQPPAPGETVAGLPATPGNPDGECAHTADDEADDENDDPFCCDSEDGPPLELDPSTEGVDWVRGEDGEQCIRFPAGPAKAAPLCGVNAEPLDWIPWMIKCSRT